VRESAARVERMFDQLLEAPMAAVPLEDLRATTATVLALVSNDDLLSQVADLEAARRLVDAAEARLLGEIDARGASDLVVGMKTKAWLRHTCRVSGVSASRRVHASTVLRRWLPEVIDAVVAGRISMDHAEVLARACNPRVAERIACGLERIGATR